MSKESTLKKEFTQRDVQRMRNLISGKTGEKTRIQVGYEKHSVDYQEGDTWEDSGKVWTIKNGIKQNITKFDEIKKLVVLPLACPCCKKAMKVTDVNKKMYSIHGKCFDCVIDMEHELRKKGEYQEYEKRMLNANKDSLILDLDKALDAWLSDKEEYLTEQGDIEDWSESASKSKMYDEAKEILQKMRDADL